MGATDARPVPKKGVAYRHYFAIRKNDGTLITTWAGQDTNLSKDGGNYVAADNEATEIQTSGTGYIDLTAAEMDYDNVVLLTTVTNTDALPYIVTLFPEEAGDIRSDVTQVSGDATAADNLELQYDGTGVAGDTFPSTQAQLGAIANVGAALNVAANANSLITTGLAVSGTYANTAPLDGVFWQIADAAGTTEMYFQFDVTPTGVPVSAKWTGYLSGVNDSLKVYAYNWGLTSWNQIGTVTGKATAVLDIVSFDLFTSHVGTGADEGKVRIRFANTGLTTSNFYTDQIFVAYSVVTSSVGYAGGSLWFDSVNGTAGAVEGVNGVADLPCNTWADIVTLVGTTGLTQVEIANGSTVTLAADADNYTLKGSNWVLDLNGQSIDDIKIEGAHVTGIGTALAANLPHLTNCFIGAVTLPPCYLEQCGIGSADGLFTGGTAGEYVFHNCYSLVAGSGTPDFKFDGLGSATGVNNRAWTGGSSWTLDSDCTVSQEVLAGGGQTFVTGGASVEVRGVCRAFTATLSGAGTVQFVGVVGPITLSGTATTVVNLYGVSSSLADTSVNTTVTDSTQRKETIAGATLDEALSGHAIVGSAGAKLTAIPTTAMRGTEDAALASVCTEGRLAELDPANLPADLDATLADTNELQTNQDGDIKIDKTGTPWELVWYKAGTAVEIFRKKLYQHDGTAVSSASHLVAQQTQDAL